MGWVQQAPVNRHQQALAPERAKAADRSIWAHVNASPGGIERTDLKHAEVKRAKLLTNFTEPSPLTGVGAIVDVVAGASQNEGRPQRLKAIEEAAPGEVARR